MTLFLVRPEPLRIFHFSGPAMCIEDMSSLAIISDKSNSIEMIIQAMFPNAYHRLCYRHLLHRSLNEDCRTWIDTIGYGNRVRLFFLVVQSNIMTSNSVDSINALSRDAQKLPITMLIDFFRATMQQCWC
uniref:MULE transposase domain-containing protein n=1 Tax=Lactuca sativa TaxID=4236 RepID=A0A9R1X9S1_LACSA|nr:hypothetical protein LSAT_V11C600313480 [Lactuca sativa]